MEQGYDERGSKTGTRLPLNRGMRNACNTYFLSDLHLGAAYDKGSRDRERRAVAFLDSIKHKAKAVYLLGDILDYWYEYRYVVPRGFVRLFGKLAELSDEGVEITWLTGNHDIWIFDYLPTELGIRVVDSSLAVTINGSDFYLAHGDRTGCDSRWFCIMQKLFRNKFCQRLYASLNPRWTIPFALRWSTSSRQKPQLSDNDERSAAALLRLENFCKGYLADHPLTRYFLFGHLHIVARRSLGKESEMIVLGDWLKHFSYAVFDGHSLSLHSFHPSADTTSQLQ